MKIELNQAYEQVKRVTSITLLSVEDVTGVSTVAHIEAGGERKTVTLWEGPNYNHTWNDTDVVNALQALAAAGKLW
jgi:hypothetical protein